MNEDKLGVKSILVRFTSKKSNQFSNSCSNLFFLFRTT